MIQRLVKTYDGSGFQERALKTWDGSNWVERQVHYFDGEEWVPAAAEHGSWQFTVRTGPFPPFGGQSYNFVVYFSAGSSLHIDWGDGTSTNTTSFATQATKSYSSTSTEFTVSISGSVASGQFHFRTPPNSQYPRIISTGSIAGISGITDLSGLFEGQTLLTSLPSGFLDKAVNVTKLDNAFKNSDIETIPSGLFDKNLNVTSFVDTFAFSNLAAIPSGLLDKNTAAQNLYGMFRGTPIETVPQGLFDKTTGVKSFHNTFEDCTSLTTFPYDLFDKIVAPQTFRDCFRRCSNLEGVAPPLWTMFPNAEGNGCFAGCTKLSNYYSIPNRWRS